ncbi:hypothetical protein B0H17DRAFT_1331864 [Mycena rosella]|uniref:Uncharacterized protein n=1 Tax=Mycena rosella TaxID=1033263 RepID=A0AAD7DE53_MYCRO|nr:hypothetical protein B0H17DRAFT_1331864 [Mycena rosella]
MDSASVQAVDWAIVYPEIIQSASSLFLNGICVLLGVYFLGRKGLSGRRVFVCAIVVLCILAIAQMIHQVVITALMLRAVSSPAGVQEIQSTIQHLAQVKGVSGNFLILINNFGADGLLSRYKRWVVSLPLILLLFTTIFGCVTRTLPEEINDFHSDIVNAVVGLGLIITNILLTGLTAGRIWWTRHTLRVLGQPKRLQRHNTAIAMLLESGALYFAVILTFLVAQLVGGSRAFESAGLAVLCGASAQLMNIAPALIVVRVGLARCVDADHDPTVEVRLNSLVFRNSAAAGSKSTERF